MENTKVCSTCREEKSISDFSKNAAKKDGLSNSCKLCKSRHQRNWYKNHGDTHRRNVRKRSDRLAEENRERLLEYLRNHPCVDCGEKDPVVLEFDHVRGDKKIEISKLIGQSYSWDAVLIEIDKCEVRCANCHRRKTAISQSWFKHAPLT